jgi:ferredoxin
MKLKVEAPPPIYPFAYEKTPRSGNDINGLGLRENVRPHQVFHNTGRGAGRSRIDWADLDTLFNMSKPWSMFSENMKVWWERRHAAGPVKGDPIEVPDPRAMADEIKAKARECGADLVGITRYDEDSQYEGRSWPYKYVICLGNTMDIDELAYTPSERSSVEIVRAYRRGSKTANALAKHIRTLGWQAEAFGNGEDIVMIPMSINAGLGQLGKHGSMISREHGSNFRISLVMTDLPMALDAPVDIGVDDLCASCQACTKACPPNAISDAKQWVRGVQKWYVDFDKCVPYFALTHGCGICLAVCPWSEPGHGPWLSEKLLEKRKRTMAPQ